MCGEDNDHDGMRLIKRRVLINSADRAGGGSTTDYVINLSPALENIVSIDWVASSVTGYMLSIAELTSTGYTSGNTQYWRYIAESVNNRYSKTQEAFEAPRNYRTLTIRWRFADGSTPNSFGETTLELEFWEKTGDLPVQASTPCGGGKK
jgi:hypothetical protein